MQVTIRLMMMPALHRERPVVEMPPLFVLRQEEKWIHMPRAIRRTGRNVISAPMMEVVFM